MVADLNVTWEDPLNFIATCGECGGVTKGGADTHDNAISMLEVAEVNHVCSEQSEQY